MNKATEGQKKLLILLLMAIVFFAAYRFGYQRFMEQTDALAEENAALEEEIADLKIKAANRELYETMAAASDEKVKEIVATFGPGVTPEKSILFFIELAKTAQMQIPTISFGDASMLFTTSSLVGEEGAPYSQYAATYSVAYSTTYEGLKTLIAYINQYPEKMNLSTLTAAYNSETDSLSGNFSINWYMLTGTDKQYRFEDLETVDIGNENIFRSGSGAPTGEGGLDFNFDFGFEEDDGFGSDDEAGADGSDESANLFGNSDIAEI